MIQAARAINILLLGRLLTPGNMQDIVDSFAVMGFPNCGRVSDGMHIPILAPNHLTKEYINHQGYISMMLQSLVDHQGRFTDINVG